MKKILVYLSINSPMNSDSLREKITEKLKEKGLSISGAEKRAKIGMSVLRYFLSGRIKTLKPKNIISLAEILEINPSELIDTKDTNEWDGDFYEEIFKGFRNILEDNNVSISSAAAISLIQEFYFSHYKDRPIDIKKTLSEWLVKELLKKVGTK